MDRNTATMASPYAFQNHQAPAANGAYARYNPALYSGGLGGGGGGVPGVPTVATSPATAVAAGYGHRRPSVSPMRGSMRGPAEVGECGEYNPQHYGPVTANGGYVQISAGGDAPPPYSPPQPARHSLNPRLQLSPPHQRQHSWPYNSNNTPVSPANHAHSPIITPSSATSQAFSPLFSHGSSAVSSANTTPQSPYAPVLQDQSNWNSPSRRRNYSPPAGASIGTQGYAPSGLQQTSYPSPEIAAPSSPIVSPRSGSRGPNNIPPPPPGPPPMRRDTSPMTIGSHLGHVGRNQSTSSIVAMQIGMGMGLRSHSNSPHERAQMSQHPPAAVRGNSLSRIPPPPPGPPPRDISVPRGPIPPGAVRGDSQSRGSIPPPPPGPPPRNTSVPRMTQGGTPNQRGSVSSPVPDRMASRSPPQPGRLSVESDVTVGESFGIAASTIAPATTATTASPPLLPPKRKMESEQAPHKKSSPGPSSRQEGGLWITTNDENNPWKQSMNSRIAATADEIPLRKGSAPRIDTQTDFVPLIDLDRNTTPQPRGSHGSPPISPENRIIRRKPLTFTSPSPVTEEPPKQLPTPPPTRERGSRGPRTISHLLHNPTPNNARLQAPLLEDEESMDGFYVSALERHRKMIRSESSAQTDEKRVTLWMDFVVKECQLREERYPEAVRKMKSVITTQLGTAFSAPEGPTQELSPISPVLRGMDGGDVEMGNSEEATRRRPETQWWGQYVENSINDHALEARIRDEESSRGRTSSRWWEASVEGSQSDYHAVRSDGFGEDDFGFGRGSHRYSRTTRASLREIAEHAMPPRNPMHPSDYVGSSAYPPDRKYSRSRSRPAQSRTRSIQSRPVKTSLDIAPLLTLLPAYPREYPAVNNAHPHLAVFRNLVRTLNDLSTVNAAKRDFNAASTGRKEAFTIEALKRRNQHSEYIQQLYTSGNSSSNGPSKRFSFDHIESLNSDFQAREDSLAEESLKSEFDLFQSQVVDVTHTDLQDRISAASAAYTDLIKAIKSSADTPQGGQEEGGEIPELLEKLTCLKWIFDVREQLHREICDLLAERNRRYKEVVTTPFFVSRQADKIREAEEFFMHDENTRRQNADKESLERYSGFLEIVENNCMKGVEMQISAFWEVTPLIMECFEKIPMDLTNVHPIVPPEEFHENPAYLREPLRYLLAKIQQAERSVYQFVEGQTNLLCLLHEIKTLTVAASCKVKCPNDQKMQGETREREAMVLTEDLKEKVKMLENEWQESLGSVCEEIKDRVGRFVGPEVAPTTPVV